MEEKLSGIVLSGINYGEADKILDIFTLEKGRITACAKGVKKAGAKLKFAAEPFCFAEYIVHGKGDRNTLTGASLTDSFYPLRENAERFYAAAALAEFIKKFCFEGMVSPQMFVLFASALKELAYGGGAPKKLVARFMVSALEKIGYALNLGGCADCGNDLANEAFFDCALGAFFCGNCRKGRGRKIKATTFAALKDIHGEREICAQDTSAALKLIAYYVSNKTGEELKVLRQLAEI